MYGVFKWLYFNQKNDFVVCGLLPTRFNTFGPLAQVLHSKVELDVAHAIIDTEIRTHASSPWSSLVVSQPRSFELFSLVGHLDSGGHSGLRPRAFLSFPKQSQRGNRLKALP